MNLDQLREEAKSFVISDQIIAHNEEGRLSFLQKFPLEKILELKLEEYALGTNDESFCYWLEFKDILLGIGGGNASKFGLYKSDLGYVSGTGKRKRILEGQELENFFQQIKQTITEALHLTMNDRVSEIGKLKIPVWDMVLQKILCVYFPEKFLTIASSDLIRIIALDIGLEEVYLTTTNIFLINHECKKKLDSFREFKDWPYFKLGSYIWKTFSPESKRDYYIIGSKYGNNGEIDVFPQMMKKSVISTGFAADINLSGFFQKSSSEIVAFLKQRGQEVKSYNALKYFLNLKVGDRIAIKADGSPKGKKGFLSIVGIAEVVERDGKIYEYDPEGLGHLINVNYLEAPIYKEFDLGGYGRTIHKLSKPQHIKEIFNLQFKENPQESSSSFPYNRKKIMDISLNTILFGPPGTGKTYNTINIALEILGEDLNGKNREEIVTLYNTKVRSGQITFTTFHQSISYEDFIEGIKPITTKNRDVIYEVREGLFKQLCSSSNLFKINDTFGPRDQYLISHVNNFFLRVSRENGSIDFSMEFIKELLDLYHQGLIGPEDLILKNREKIRKMMATEWDKYLFGYESIYRALLLYIKEKDQTRTPDSGKKVIIIDEINRGNISNIFGELITLIEDDKRIGKENFTPATLPYSGELFGVPPNLYILGTMNTADRSVEALDTALRRRFSFLPMDPQPGLLDTPQHSCKGIDLSLLLGTMNRRIEKLLDKDHCIGHSYFMTIKDKEDPLPELIIIFKNKIIPLLQEYFYGDWGKVSLVIGEAFVAVKKEAANFLCTDSYEDFEMYDEKPIYYFTDHKNWTLTSFRSIYE